MQMYLATSGMPLVEITKGVKRTGNARSLICHSIRRSHFAVVQHSQRRAKNESRTLTPRVSFYTCGASALVFCKVHHYGKTACGDCSRRRPPTFGNPAGSSLGV